jgi:exopolysaccharide production protein ExoQ
MVIGGLFVILYSFAVGEYAEDAIDGGFTFVGAFGSKNQLGFFSSLTIYFAAVLVLAIRVNVTEAIFCAFVTLLALVALIWCRSATSLATTVAGLAIFVALLTAMRFPPSVRIGMLILMVPVTLFLTALGGGYDLILNLLGKNSTLTGRTFLWAHGFEEIALRPLTGVGYQAYWVEGRPAAEFMWAYFMITGKSGFHFHNMWIETAVEIGIVGFILFALMFVLIFVRYFKRVFGGNDRIAAAMLGLLAMMLGRSMVEVDFLTTYALGSFLMFWMLCTSRIDHSHRRHSPKPATALSSPSEPIRVPQIVRGTDPARTAKRDVPRFASDPNLLLGRNRPEVAAR